MTHDSIRTPITILLGALVPLGCAPSGPSVPQPVPEDEIPALQAQLRQEPERLELQARIAASLLAADRCDEAVAVAREAVLSPFDSWPTRVQGECLERSGRLDEALDVYRDYLDIYGDAEGAPSVRGRTLLAERRAAEALAEELLRAPPAEGGPANRIAVLPFRVRGDDELDPVGRTIAVRLSNDLAEVEGLEVVDPLLVRLVLERLGPVGELGMDSASARRVGRAVGAGQVVQGTVFLAESSLNRLGTDILRIEGGGGTGGRIQGPLSDLARLEKELSLATARALGEPPSPDERTRILYRGPRGLPSLVAYGRGLDLEAREEYEEASVRYGEVVRQDPEFDEARQALEATAAAAALTGSRDVLAEAPVASAAVAKALDPGRGVNPLRLAIRAGTSDVSATQGERVTGVVAATAEDGSVGSIQNLESPALLTPSKLTGLVRILVVVPGG